MNGSCLNYTYASSGCGHPLLSATERATRVAKHTKMLNCMMILTSLNETGKTVPLEREHFVFIPSELVDLPMSREFRKCLSTMKIDNINLIPFWE